MSNSKRKIISISLLSLSLSAGVALVPVLAQLAQVFPQYIQWIQMLITLPSLFMMFSSLLTDKLVKLTSVKRTVLVSLAIILFSGISPYWISGFVYLMFTRMLMGVGLGFLNTAISSLPAIYFEDTAQRDSALGVQSAFSSAGGVVFSVLSGFLAKYNWKYVFLIQLINLIPIASVICIMPDCNMHQIPPENEKNKNVFVKSAFPIVVFAFTCIILTCTYPLNLSLFVEASSLGDSAFVSLLTATNSAIGFFIGMFFGRVYKKLQNNTLVMGLLFAGAAMLIVSFAPSGAVLFAGSICFGVGTSFISPSLYSALYSKVPAGEIISAVALLGIAANVSQFVSPFIINPIAAFIDGAGQERTRLILAGILILCLALFAKIKNENKGEQN